MKSQMESVQYKPLKLPGIKLSEIEPGQARQIERAKQEWEVTVDALPQLVCLLDRQGCIIRANRTVERWRLGRVTEVKGRRIHEFLHAGCSDSTCYLTTFWDRAWNKLVQAQPVEYEAEDEILKRYLSLEIHPLPSQIAGRNESSASFAVLVVDDITKQKRAEEALRQYALELEIRNEELDAFAHTVAHNLKGALMPIVGNTGLLRRRYNTMPPELIQKELKAIAQGGQRMNSIIR